MLLMVCDDKEGFYFLQQKYVQKLCHVPRWVALFCNLEAFFQAILINCPQGLFNNYVKGSKMSFFFVHAQGVNIVYAGCWGVKKDKILSV